MGKYKKRPNVITLAVIILIFGILISWTFSKYVIQKIETQTQESTEFYFVSNITENIFEDTSATHEINNWNGRDTQKIEFNIRNYIDNMQKTDENIIYKIATQIEEQDLASVQVQNSNGDIITDNELTLTGGQLSKENYKLLITPESSSIANGTTINIELKITSISPYKKEIISTIKLTAQTIENYETNLIDLGNEEYVELNIKVNNPNKDIIVKYDNTKLEIDRANTLLSDVSIATQETIDSFTITKSKLEEDKTYEIIFIKKVSEEVTLGTDIIIE